MENTAGELVLDMTMDVIDGPPYTNAYPTPSGYGIPPMNAVTAEHNIWYINGDYTMVQYEDLVTHPEETLKSVCAFLGEDFEPRMLKYYERPANELRCAD